MELERNENIFTLSAQSGFLEFKSFLYDVLYKTVSPKIRLLESEEFLYKKLKYSALGTIFIYNVSPIKDGLEISISTENGLLSKEERNWKDEHLLQILKEIESKFSFEDSILEKIKKIVPEPRNYEVIERLWSESIATEGCKAWLSTVVLLGSVLEAILYYEITKTEENRILAGKSGSAPKYKGTVKPFEDWRLNDMIVVAHKCGWINHGWFMYADTLREHRNFIHPFLQLENKFFLPDKDTCELSRSVIKGIVNRFLESSGSQT